MRIVIIGGGFAAATAAEELREQGFDGEVALFAAEDELPYERPPLSKGVLTGDEEPDSVHTHDRGWYEEKSIELHLGEPVTAIDPRAKNLTTAQGTSSYDRLILATGSRARRFGPADAASVPVHYLRTLADSTELKQALSTDTSVVVIGGGWIGLEVASAARSAGATVTVVETQRLPLLGVLGEEIAQVFADLHTEHGVDLKLGRSVDRIDGATVVLDDGTELTADRIVVGIGAEPIVDLAEAAGLAVDDGVLVDARLRTSDPDVYAVGDIASHDHPTLGRRVRVEHWDNAAEQAKVAAHNAAGASESYDRQPYFFTDQYDFGMEYSGSVGPDGYDEVVTTGDLAAREFRAFWVKGGTVVAAMHGNDWDAGDAIKEAVGGPVPSQD